MRIDLCSVLLNDSDTERQTISYDAEDHRLYSTAQEEPLDDGYQYESLEQAMDACCDKYFRTWGWYPEWI